MPLSGYELPRTLIVSDVVAVTRKNGPASAFSVAVPPPASVKIWFTATFEVSNVTATSATRVAPFWSSPTLRWRS